MYFKYKKIFIHSNVGKWMNDGEKSVLHRCSSTMGSEKRLMDVMKARRGSRKRVRLENKITVKRQSLDIHHIRQKETIKQRMRKQANASCHNAIVSGLAPVGACQACVTCSNLTWSARLHWHCLFTRYRMISFFFAYLLYPCVFYSGQWITILNIACK